MWTRLTSGTRAYVLLRVIGGAWLVARSADRDPWGAFGVETELQTAAWSTVAARVAPLASPTFDRFGHGSAGGVAARQVEPCAVVAWRETCMTQKTARSSSPTYRGHNALQVLGASAPFRVS